MSGTEQANRGLRPLRETGISWVADPDDVEAISSTLEEIYGAWQDGALEGRILPADLRRRLDRRARAEEMGALMRRVL